MGDFFQPVHLLILLFVFGLIFLIPAILYILTLVRTLNKCAVSSRTLDPVMAWLYLIPIVNLVIHFVIVFGMSKTLRNEFNRRAVPVDDPTPVQSLGLAMCICACCSIVPILGLLATLAHLILWIMYWVKIAEYSRLLGEQPVTIMPPGTI
jgi:hypothetical protein